MTWSRDRWKHTIVVLSVIKVRYRIAQRSNDKYEYDHISRETRNVTIRWCSWKISVRSSMTVWTVDTHTNHISVVKGTDGYRKYVRVISMISTYEKKYIHWRHTDGSGHDLRIKFDIKITYCRKYKYQNWRDFPNSFDWCHWLDFWADSFLPFWRCNIWYVSDYIFLIFSFNDFSLCALFIWHFFRSLHFVS